MIFLARLVNIGPKVFVCINILEAKSLKSHVGTWAAMFMYFGSSFANLALQKIVIFHEFYIFYFSSLFFTVKISYMNTTQSHK